MFRLNASSAQLLLFSLMLLLVVNSGAPASAASRFINYVSETPLAGDVADIQGGNFTPTDQAMIQAYDLNGVPIAGSQTSLTILVSSANLLQVRLPTTYPFALWGVWVQDAQGASLSNTRYIHQAQGVRFNTDAVAPGGSLEIWGRNLSDPWGVARGAVYFVDPSGASFRAQANPDGVYHMSLSTPSTLTPGVSYQVYVSNGLGGKLGQTLINAPLTIRTGGADPLKLGVPWAADFTYLGASWQAAPNTYNVKTDPRLALHAAGDGKTNDTLAVQQAIDTASKDARGGGVVYLPTGTYLLGPSGQNNVGCLAMRTHVILMGDGWTTSVLKPDANLLKPAMISNYLLFDYFGAKQCGMMNLGIQYVNDVAPGHRTFVGSGSGANTTSEVFFKYVMVDISSAQQMAFAGADHILFDNCSITNKNGQTLQALGSRWITLQNSTFAYALGRMDLTGADYIVLRSNTFYRYGWFAKPGNGESGGVQVSFAHTPVLTANTFIVSSGALGGNNDGEAVLTQDAAYYWYFRDAGTLTQSAGTQSLTDLSKDWSSVSLIQSGTGIQPGSTVKIQSGPALGQWRTIVGVTQNTLQLDRPWDIIPPSGSAYTIGPWSADRVFVLNNTFTDPVSSPIELYAGAWYCTVAGNRSSTSTKSAYLVPDHRIWIGAIDAFYPPQQTGGPLTPMVNPAWNNLVAGNTLSNANPSRSAQIQVYMREVQCPLHGVGALNNELRSNLLTSQLLNTNGLPISTPYDGYWVWGMNFGGPITSLPGSAIVGTLLSGNQEQNIAPPYTIGSDVLQSMVIP